MQTTVSRDIAELGLVKVRAASGALVYKQPGTADLDRLRELEQAFRRWALSIEASDALVVVFTPRGFAAALGDAIDESGHPACRSPPSRARTRSSSSRSPASRRATLREELSRHLLEGAA